MHKAADYQVKLVSRSLTVKPQCEVPII